MDILIAAAVTCCLTWRGIGAQEFQYPIVGNYYPSGTATPLTEHFANVKGYCAAVCTVNASCRVALFGKHDGVCLIFDTFGDDWIPSDRWEAMVKWDAGSQSSLSTKYGVAQGTAVTASGKALATLFTSNALKNASQCQTLCEQALSSCTVFYFSVASYQCILLKASVMVTGFFADAFMQTYYKFTTASMTTQAAYAYVRLPYDVSNVSWVTFSVQSCHDAHISLQPATSGINSISYEFAIGGWSNSQTCVRRVFQGSVLACSSGAYLNCNSPGQLWISWTSGILRFGRGNIVGQSTAFSYADPAPYPVKAIALSGWSGSAGHWTLQLPTYGLGGSGSV